ncbi:sugar phosphate isomerase/epimerase family protein [Microbacterium xylanilyticum]|nr:sugar phosphate isomerase/epimerase [Actinomycetota bacterium]
MNIGCHALVWTGEFDASGIRSAAERTRAAGFDLIEYPLMDPSAFDAAVAADAVAEHGLAVSASLGLAEATDVTSEDRAVVAAGEALLLRAVDVVAEMGGGHFCGVLYSAMKKYMQPATARGLENSRRAIARVADHAAERGIRVSLEVVNRYETNVLNTARQALAYLADVDRQNLGIHLDTYHMNIEESDMFAPVLDAAPHLQYVHIGESHRGYLGTGSVDFGTFFKALGRIGYDGPIVFESFSSAVVAPDLSRMLGIWRNLWTNGDELGAHANAFIRNKLVAIDSLRLH